MVRVSVCVTVIFLLVSRETVTAAVVDPSKNPAFENPKNRITPIDELVKSHRYPIDGYRVVTEDDYILTVYRIRHGRDGQGTNKVPVFLQHGIMDSAVAFLASSTSLAYYLADNGYDVWMGNSRGTLYSRKHKSLDPDKDSKYWDFSFHEMGVFDLPAVLRLIRQETKVDKVNYIGMSMGSTMFLAMSSLHPDLLDMVDCVIFLAPVARPSHMQMLVGPRLYANWAFFNTMHFFGVREFLSHKETPAMMMHKLCNSKGWAEKVCARILHSISPRQMDLYDFEKAKDSIMYFPAGSTVKTYKHYLQMAYAGRFQQFDYGKKQNKIIYGGSERPPEYDLKKIQKRLYLIAGGLDNIAAPEDIQWLQKKLPDAVLITKKFERFSHRDFIFGLNLEETLFETINEIFIDCKNYKGE